MSYHQVKTSNAFQPAVRMGSPMEKPLSFAQRVLATSGPVTPLKLQKLMFYAYGAALVEGAMPLGSIPFLAWKHGPVSCEVFEALRGFGSSLVPVDPNAAPLDGLTRDAVRVYGSLSAWQLREESHLEAPWVGTTQSWEIDQSQIFQHFAQKYAAPVVAPRNLAGSWSLAVDGLPQVSSGSLGELATALGR